VSTDDCTIHMILTKCVCSVQAHSSNTFFNLDIHLKSSKFQFQILYEEFFITIQLDQTLPLAKITK